MDHDSSRTDDDEDDLDGILDSALEEFDVGTLPEPPCLQEAPSATTISDAASAIDPSPVASQDAETTLGAASSSPTDELRAFDEAISSLDALAVNGGEAGGAGNDEPTEEEDLKLVEDFLKSLSSQFESMGLSEEDPAGASAGSTSRADAALTAAAAAAVDGGGDGKLPSEAEIDRITRDLEALLKGDGGSQASSGGAGTSQARAVDEEFASAPEPSGPTTENRANGVQGLGGSGGDEFNKIVESVVGELLSKEVLKGPMERMRVAFAEWLPRNVDALSKEDADRYRKQSSLVDQICVEYEKDDCEMANVMTLLAEMQSTGAPPQAVMGNLDDGDDSPNGNTAKNLDSLLNTQDCPVQ